MKTILNKTVERFMTWRFQRWLFKIESKIYKEKEVPFSNSEEL